MIQNSWIFLVKQQKRFFKKLLLLWTVFMTFTHRKCLRIYWSLYGFTEFLIHDFEGHSIVMHSWAFVLLRVVRTDVERSYRHFDIPSKFRMSANFSEKTGSWRSKVRTTTSFYVSFHFLKDAFCFSPFTLLLPSF